MRSILAAITLALCMGAHAGTVYGWDQNGNYYQYYTTPQGGYGWDNGQYQQWYNTPNGGYGWSNGQYYNWYQGQ